MQFETVDDVPKEHFRENRSIYAFVERVIDGDTIRVRHYPGYAIRGQKAQSMQKRAISDCTLSIRIYGVDTPELAKFGNPSQPYAKEAKEFTSSLVLHKMVKITFLRKDQYSRAVCRVKTLPKVGWWCTWLPGFGGKDLSLLLAREGLAELYTGGGAEYCGNQKKLELLIARAQRRKRGIWSLGTKRVSAAEEKRRIRKTAQPVPVAFANTRGGRGSKEFKKKNGIEKREKVLDSVLTGLEIFAG